MVSTVWIPRYHVSILIWADIRYNEANSTLLRGEHIHHGYYPTEESKANDTKERAQLRLIELLLEISQLKKSSTKEGASQPLRVLDVGCGIGGTSRYLASELGATVTGITISTKQVEIAKRLTKAAAAKIPSPNATNGVKGEEFISLGSGKVRFLELDAEKMGDTLATEEKFDVVWISEALSHFPNKPLFFKNAQKLLRDGGKLVLADWFKGDEVSPEDVDIRAIEGEFYFLSFESSLRY